MPPAPSPVGMISCGFAGGSNQALVYCGPRSMPFFPERKSRSRRLNRRILVAMLAVALLPLAALTALLGAELAAVNQTTVDEAHSTIVADAEQRESSAAVDGAGTVQTS